MILHHIIPPSKQLSRQLSTGGSWLHNSNVSRFTKYAMVKVEDYDLSAIPSFNSRRTFGNRCIRDNAADLQHQRYSIHPVPNLRSKAASDIGKSHLFSSSSSTTKHKASDESDDDNSTKIRLSKLIAQKGINMQMSRKSAEAVISAGMVTIAGDVVTNPSMKINLDDSRDNVIKSIKVAGKHFIYEGEKTLDNLTQQKLDINGSNINKGDDASTSNSSPEGKPPSSIITPPLRSPRVWIAHKLKGEIVAEHDPLGRPSLIERLYKGGVGKSKKKKSKDFQKIHLKPIGRLDMMTEGLILITNDGSYVREMTLPSNKIHRSYRVRVHGRITQQKLNTIRNGVNIDGTYYKGMNVNLELTKNLSRAKGGNTNSWLRITCTEGKNRMIRKVLDHLGIQVTRLIRVSFGDYDLNTIPPGLAIEVPFKSLESQKRKGIISQRPNRKKSSKSEEKYNREFGDNARPSPVEWIRHSQ